MQIKKQCRILTESCICLQAKREKCHFDVHILPMETLVKRIIYFAHLNGES